MNMIVRITKDTPLTIPRVLAMLTNLTNTNKQTSRQISHNTTNKIRRFSIYLSL